MKKILYFLIPVALVVLIYFSMPSGLSQEAHVEEVMQEREEKETFLKTNSASPFRQAGLEMHELSYFPIDLDYRVTARVEKVEKRLFSNIQNSDGTMQRYLKFAWLHFEINDQEQKLLVLKPQFGVGLFLAFADETSGDSSYGGGRYLDIDEIKGDRITLDFNLAYNP